jgi:peptidoglycan hydrolase CwlO-like protein
MKYLFFILLIGCSVKKEKENLDQEKDTEFKELILGATENQNNFQEIDKKAKEKQEKLVSETIGKIVTLKKEIKDLKTEMKEIKPKIDTVFIRDTVYVKETKNFWGKTKMDTTNKE